MKRWFVGIGMTLALLAAVMSPISAPVAGIVSTERGPVHTLPNCLQPPVTLTTSALLKLSPTMLSEYGIAPPNTGIPLSKWLALNDHLARHICQHYFVNVVGQTFPRSSSGTGGKGPFASHGYTNDIWTGKVADQNCASNSPYNIACNDGSHTYTETDTDYYTGCPTGLTPELATIGSAAAWAGIGGASSSLELEQTGADVVYYQGTGDNWSNEQYAWTDYAGPQWEYQSVLGNGHPGEYLVGCDTHMFAEEYGGDCAWIKNLDANWSYQWCSRPTASSLTAELILERDGGYENQTNPVGVFWGADATFYGADGSCW